LRVNWADESVKNDKIADLSEKKIDSAQKKPDVLRYCNFLVGVCMQKNSEKPDIFVFLFTKAIVQVFSATKIRSKLLKRN
jgi:hypothetical protein